MKESTCKDILNGQEGLFLHQIPYLFNENNIHKDALIEKPC